jgi:MATE family multidrug resistance protein
MILAWITVLANIGLDWLLVLGNLGFPALGVAGAAYATVMANGVNVMLSAFVLWRAKNRAQFGTGQARWMPWSEIRTGLTIGLPIGMGDFIEIASFSAFFALIARLGTDILAANQIALQYMSISFTFGIAISMASSSLVSQYLGAKSPDLAEKAAYRAIIIAAIGMGLIGLSYLIAPERLIGLFSDEATVIEAGVTILRLIALYQIFDGIGIVMSGVLNGAGDTQFTMWARTVLAWGMFIPLSWFMIFRTDTGVWGAWVAALVYLAGLAAIFFIRFRMGYWKTIEVG